MKNYYYRSSDSQIVHNTDLGFVWIFSLCLILVSLQVSESIVHNTTLASMVTIEC